MVQLDLEQCISTACIWEVTARKAGNVHRHKSFPGLGYADFVASANAIAPVMARMVDAPIGETVLECVKATRKAVETNTNLGIILLLAPLSKTDEYTDKSLRKLLATTTVADAEAVYEAIRLAAPGGLGRVAEQDVAEVPTVNLWDAMSLAANRDSIALQYEDCFADIFEAQGIFDDSRDWEEPIEEAILQSQFEFLCELPDSLIRRKCGDEAAEDVQRRARAILGLGGLESEAGLKAFAALDAHLRSDGNRLNPGTTADLVAASLFVWLRTNKIDPDRLFEWDEYAG